MLTQELRDLISLRNLTSAGFSRAGELLDELEYIEEAYDVLLHTPKSLLASKVDELKKVKND